MFIKALTGATTPHFSPDIKEHVRHIEKAVSTKEPRFMSRVIRALVTVRRKLNPRILRSLMKGYFIAPNVINKEELLPFLADVMLFF